MTTLAKATTAAIIFAVLLAVTTSTVLADNGWPGSALYASSCGPWGFGYYPWASYYSQDTVPYYALHPPVYYSYPVPRTYGYSPFPYPPCVLTPEVPSPEPKIIRNQYVPRPAAPESQTDRVTQRPLRIRNPYVAQADTPAVVPTATQNQSQPVRPQIIYPARLSQPL